MADQLRNHAQTSTSANGEPLVAHLSNIIQKIRARTSLSKILVVAASSYSAFFLKRAVTDNICRKNGRGLFNVEFMRIDDVADILFDASIDRPGKPTLSDLIGFELVHNAIGNLSIDGPLSEHTENESTIAAVQRTIQQLDLLDSGADNALKRIVAITNLPLYRQLSDIHRRFKLDAEGYMTSAEKSRIAANIAADEPGFVSKILAPDIILLRAPVPPDVHTVLWGTLQTLPNADTVSILAETSAVTNGAPTERTVRFYSAAGTVDEPRALIRNIMADARNGIKFGQVAVFYTSADYASRIKDALDFAEIPNCGPSTKTLAGTPAGRFVSSFIAMLSDGMRRQSFAAWTSTSPVVYPTTKTRVPSVLWEIATRDAKISRFTDQSDWENALDRYARSLDRRARRIESGADEGTDKTDPESLKDTARNARFLKRFINDLADIADTQDIISWSGWSEWMRKVIETYLAPNDDDIDGLDHVHEGLTQIGQLDAVSQSHVDRGKFSRTVQRLLRKRVGASSGWGKSVLVAPLNAGTANAFKSIHILGMSEGVLPGPGRTDPLLSDHLRQVLDPNCERLLTRAKQLELERAMFQMARSSAPINHFYWNKAITGATNESYPSPWFVDEVQKANGQTNIPVKSLMEPESQLVESVVPLAEFHSRNHVPASTYEFDLLDVAIQSQSESTRTQILRQPSSEPLRAGHAVAQARRSGVFGPFDGGVGTSLVNTMSEWRTSATALENYATCPYRFFLANELRVTERVDPEESLELSALDRGTLVHKILENYLELHGVDLTVQGQQALREVAIAEIDRFQTEEFIGFNSIFELEKVKLLQELETWHRTGLQKLVGYDAEFMTEQSFGREDDYGQVELDDGFTIKLRGQIDLIAISLNRERARVLDFKTGRTSYSDIDKDVTDAGRKLQLPIYSKAAFEILGGSTDIDAAYWFVFLSGADEFRPKNYVSFECATKEFRPVIATIMGGIRAGAFPARPGDSQSYGEVKSWKNCEYCPYDTVCSSNRLIEWNRKKSAPVLQDYVTLAEKTKK